MSSSLRIFLLICAFRIFNTFLIQSYFDPDEFWQTLEPAYCAVFRPGDGFDCPGFTWEWKRRAPESSHLLQGSLLGPVRTYLSVLPTHIFYTFIECLGLDSSWMVARGPMIFYAITVAAPVDWAIWYCARALYSLPSSSSALPSWSLLASLSAWFNAYTLVRTYSNSQEAVLLMLSLWLVAEDLLCDSPKKDISSSSRRSWRARAAFLLGGMSLSIRGTAVAAYIPMGILLALQEASWPRRVAYLFNICALCGSLGIGVALLVDYWFFEFPTLPFVGNFHFNVILHHGTVYGSHPWYWYLIAGVPAVAGVLFPILLTDWISMKKWSKGRRNLWIIVVIYIAAMSMNAHKEFRFILPLLPLFCLLAGEKLHRIFAGHVRRTQRIAGIATLFIANLIAVLYLGLFHQSGPITVNREILRLTKQMMMDPSTPVRVDYWTGGCHSTPLLSSLHSPPFRFETRTLDCSPSCRADPHILCETDRFHHDPVTFLQDAYPRTCSSEGVANDATCDERGPTLPSFVVTTSNYVATIANYMNDMGLYETGRFPLNICGARLPGIILGDEFGIPTHRHVEITSMLELCVEDVVLFARSPSRMS